MWVAIIKAIASFFGWADTTTKVAAGGALVIGGEKLQEAKDTKATATVLAAEAKAAEQAPTSVAETTKALQDGKF